MRRHFSNIANPTALTSNVNASVTTLNVVSTAGYPAVPYTIGIDRGIAGEEVCLVTAHAPTTMTVVRGYNGTTAASHLAGASIEHCTVADDHEENNAHVNETGRDDYTQYLNQTRLSQYLPKAYNGTSPSEVAPVTTSWQTVGTVTVPSATFSRKMQVTSQIPIGFADGNVRARLLSGATVVSTGVSNGATFDTIPLISDWLVIASGTSPTFAAQVRRDSGGGGTGGSDDADYNKITVLVIANY